MSAFATDYDRRAVPDQTYDVCGKNPGWPWEVYRSGLTWRGAVAAAKRCIAAPEPHTDMGAYDAAAIFFSGTDNRASNYTWRVRK